MSEFSKFDVKYNAFDANVDMLTVFFFSYNYVSKTFYMKKLKTPTFSLSFLNFIFP